MKLLEPGDIRAKETLDGKTKVVLRSLLLRDGLHSTLIFKEGLIRKGNFKSFFFASLSCNSFFSPISVSLFLVAEGESNHCTYLLLNLLKSGKRFHFSTRRLFVTLCRLLVSPAELWERTGWRPPANHPLARGSRER